MKKASYINISIGSKKKSAAESTWVTLMPYQTLLLGDTYVLQEYCFQYAVPKKTGIIINKY